MKILTCPLNGPRNISEFTYGGELKAAPTAPDASHEAWTSYIFNSDNTAGVVREWWMHTASSYWFIADRNTITDEIIRTFDPAECFPARTHKDDVK